MGARWMQEKLRKQKRMRRSYLKSYNYSRGGYSPIARGQTDSGTIADYSFGARKSAASRVFEVADAYFRPSKNPEDNTPNVLFARRIGAHSDIVTVVSHMMQSGRLQKEQTWNYISIVKGTVENWWLFFSGEVCFLLRERIRSDWRYVSRSIDYPSRKVAKMHYERGWVRWKGEEEILPINPT